MKAPIIA